MDIHTNHTIGRILTRGTSAALLLASAVWAAWSYNSARNSDDAWDDVAWEVQLFPTVLAVVLAGAMGGGIGAALRRRWQAMALPIVSVVVFAVAGPVAHRIGRANWESEFNSNRNAAQAIIDRLTAFNRVHGTYPMSLSDLGPPPPPVLHRGRHQHQIQYEHHSPQRYVLSYQYGWYEYTYESSTRTWRSRD